MKREFNEEKAKIIVTVIPFVLIIIVLLISLIVGSVKGKDREKTGEELQDSIKEYADANMPDSERTDSSSAVTDSSNAAADAKEKTPDSDRQEKPSGQETPTPYQEIMQKGKVDYDKITFDKDVQLKEMMTYWEENNQKALDDLALLDRFKAMSWKLKGTKDFYYYGETNTNGDPSGTGIAVYADNQYYYGTWENGMRSGKGTWIHYHVHETPSKTDLYTYHQYTGSWKNDLPDGEGSEHYDYNMELLEPYIGYDNNLVGTYTAGQLNGEFYLTKIYSDGNIKEWEGKADHGSWLCIDGSPDPKATTWAVQVETKNPESYFYLRPGDNKNLGVICLISKNRN